MKPFLSLLLFLSVVSCQNNKKTAESAGKSTAQENVIILKPMLMNSLDRARTIRLYLPENYNESTSSYPVIYAHDGQNLFDDTTSYIGEWGLDESLNQLATETGFEAIVVGIDNGQELRVDELTPWENSEYGGGEGAEYMDFIVNQLKPHIDSTYRTLKDRDNTAILGSSLGGFISHYAIYQYPNVFGKAIIFSPSYWFASEVWDFTSENPLPSDARIWLEIGEKEGEAVDDTERMYEVILNTGHPEKNIIKKVDPDGEHNEVSWRRQFIPAIKWLFEIETQPE